MINLKNLTDKQLEIAGDAVAIYLIECCFNDLRAFAAASPEEGGIEMPEAEVIEIFGEK